MTKKQNNLYKKMIEASIIVFALLVYFYTFNGLMKLLIDRIFAIEKYKNQEEVLFKRGFQYKIKSVNKEKDRYYIKAEAVL